MLTTIELFRCLADETRLRCLALLRNNGSLCVCELTYALALSQPKISRHLSLLRQLEIVQDNRQGQWVYYELNPVLPNWADAILAIALQQLIEQGVLQADSERLHAMAGRSCV